MKHPNMYRPVRSALIELGRASIATQGTAKGLYLDPNAGAFLYYFASC